jgi:hypothetical protein
MTIILYIGMILMHVSPAGKGGDCGGMLNCELQRPQHCHTSNNVFMVS